MSYFPKGSDPFELSREYKHRAMRTRRPRRDASNPRRVFVSGQKRGVVGVIERGLRRRSAIESLIGHMKQQGHLGRCFLKSFAGDAATAILTAAGRNFRRILAWLKNPLRSALLVLLALTIAQPASFRLLNERLGRLPQPLADSFYLGRLDDTLSATGRYFINDSSRHATGLGLTATIGGENYLYLGHPLAVEKDRQPQVSGDFDHIGEKSVSAGDVRRAGNTGPLSHCCLRKQRGRTCQEESDANRNEIHAGEALHSPNSKMASDNSLHSNANSV